MAAIDKANKGDLNVGLLIVQPTKDGVLAIAKTKIRVPKRTRNKDEKSKETKKRTTKVEKPKIETVKKPTTKKSRTTKEKTERVVDK